MSRTAGLRSWLADHWLDVLVLGAALVAGVAMRRWVLHGLLGQADLDEATVGIQAIRFQRGSWATFFPQQPYGGTIEPGLVAMVFVPLGRTVTALKLVPMGLALAAAVVTWRAALRLGISRTGEWLAPILVWCGPAFAVAFSTKERGFYGVALLLAASYLLLVLRLDQDPTSGDAIALGFLVGLGFWQTPLTMMVAVPAVGWLLVRRPEILRAWLVPAMAAAVGALPWIVYNVRNPGASTHNGFGFGSTWWQRFEYFGVKLRVDLGLETPFVPDRALVPGRWSGAVLVAAMVGVASWRTRRRAPGLLVVLVLGYGALYALNGLAAGVGNDPRYTYLLVPTLALAAGALLPELDSDLLDGLVIAGCLAVVVGLSAWGLAGMGTSARSPGADKFLSSPGIEEVTAFLEANGRTTAITDLAGTQITFLSNGRVRAGSFSVPRFRDLELAGRADPRTTYVLDEGYLGNVPRLTRYLIRHHIRFEARHIGKWWVFLVDRRVLPEDAHLVRLDFTPDRKPAG